MDYNTKLRLAADTKTSPDIFTQIAEEATVELGVLLTTNPSVTSTGLQILAEHINPEVRRNVATHLHVSGEVLLKLANDTDEVVRWYAKCRPKLYVFLQHKAEQEGVCEPGVQLPVEWLQEMYLLVS